MSIAANIAHSYVPPTGVTATGWSPNFGAVIGAVFWPVALFVATEILTRVDWPTGRVWWLLRWAGMLPVAAVAALVSYRHLSGLLTFYGEESITCVLGPLAVDGLMVMATGAILATGHHQHTTTHVSAPAVPDTALPVRPARPHPTRLTHLRWRTRQPLRRNRNRHRRRNRSETFHHRLSSPPGSPEPTPPARPDRLSRSVRLPASPVPDPARPTFVRPRRCPLPATDIPVTAPEPAQLTLPIVAPDLLRRADQVARQYRTEHGTPITPGQLAVRLKVTSEQATQALAILGLGPNNPTTAIPIVNGKPVKATR